MQDLDLIIQAGGIGVAILMIGYSFAKDKMFNKTLNNHLDHFTTALDRNSEVIGGNTEVIKSCKKTLDRVDRCLDTHRK